MHSINLQRQLHLIQLSFLNSPAISDRWIFRWTHWIPNNKTTCFRLTHGMIKGSSWKRWFLFPEWSIMKQTIEFILTLKLKGFYLLLDICPLIHCPFSWFVRWWNRLMPPKLNKSVWSLWVNSLGSNTILSEDGYGCPGSGCPLFKLDPPTVSPSCASSNPKRVRKIRSDWTLLIPAPR